MAVVTVGRRVKRMAGGIGGAGDGVEGQERDGARRLGRGAQGCVPCMRCRWLRAAHRQRVGGDAKLDESDDGESAEQHGRPGEQSQQLHFLLNHRPRMVHETLPYVARVVQQPLLCEVKSRAETPAMRARGELQQIALAPCRAARSVLTRFRVPPVALQMNSAELVIAPLQVLDAPASLEANICIVGSCSGLKSDEGLAAMRPAAHQ